jgi:alpha-beta hydrolase superfamily lysophospholipase
MRIARQVVAICLLGASCAGAQTLERVVLRGKPQTLRLYGPSGGEPVIVSSGDGGWMHLGPHVAETLAARGYFVVGFDVRAYLSSFTWGRSTLRAEDEPGDYKKLVDVASRGQSRKPILIGVSEGAGLSVLAATDPQTKAAIAGVIGLGLPDLNELGWRWMDSLIYLTHRSPGEPTFSTAAIIEKVSPIPLAAIHATHDEFVPLDEVRKVIQSAREPKKLWIVNASNHRFSDNEAEFNQRLLEAIAWVKQNLPR